MFTENTKIYIKKNRVCDFIENHQQFGFSQDADGDFVLKKNLSNTQENLYVQVSFSPALREIFVEFHVPYSMWLEVGIGTFEPLFSMCKQGYLEFLN